MASTGGTLGPPIRANPAKISARISLFDSFFNAAAKAGMAAHGNHAGRQRPDMQIVNGTDAGDFLQLIVKADDVHMSGSAFQQNIDGVANQYPGAEQNQKADNGADDRIRDLIAANQNRET